MSKEDWDRVRKALDNLYGFAKLDIDGFEVTLQLVRVSTYKNAIQIFVNGCFKGKWITTDCEERRRFICAKEKSLMNSKEKDNFLKLSKKIQKELNEKYNNFTYITYQSLWDSFRSLKKHLVENNAEIKIKEICGD